MPRSLLLVCVVLGAVRCGPSPTVAGYEPQSEPTLDQLTSQLVRIVESSVSASTAGPLQMIAETLSSIQQGLTEVSNRLDVLCDSQLRLEQAHGDLSSRLESVQESQADIVGRLGQFQDPHRSSTAAEEVYETSSGAVSELDPRSESTSGQEDGTREHTSTTAFPTTTESTTTTTESSAKRKPLICDRHYKQFLFHLELRTAKPLSIQFPSRMASGCDLKLKTTINSTVHFVSACRIFVFEFVFYLSFDCQQKHNPLHDKRWSKKSIDM